jgi:hypothetical protein
LLRPPIHLNLTPSPRWVARATSAPRALSRGCPSCRATSPTEYRGQHRTKRPPTDANHPMKSSREKRENMDCGGKAKRRHRFRTHKSFPGAVACWRAQKRRRRYCQSGRFAPHNPAAFHRFEFLAPILAPSPFHLPLKLAPSAGAVFGNLPPTQVRRPSQ